MNRTFFCAGACQYYLELMAEAARASETELWAYCLLLWKDCAGHAWRGASSLYPAYQLQGELSGTSVAGKIPFLSNGRKLSPHRGDICGVESVQAKLCRMPQDWRRSSASAHLTGMNDLLVRVGPMRDRIADWGMYLASDSDTCDDILDRYSRTGRPLGDERFVSRLESLTGVVLARKRPGRRSKGADK